MKYPLNRGLAADAIIHYKDGIVLIERKNKPIGFALPGGFLDKGETAEQAVVREMKEETNLDFKGVQFKTYSTPGRDPRGPTVSVVFYGVGTGELKAGDDAKKAKVVSLEETKDLKVIFDHDQILKDYRKFVKNNYKNKELKDII